MVTQSCSTDRPYRRFGNYLNERRKEVGLTWKQVAEEVGISPSYISRVKSGVFPPPSFEILRKLSRVLHVDQVQLLDYAGYSALIGIDGEIAIKVERPSAQDTMRDPVLRKRIRQDPLLDAIQKELKQVLSASFPDASKGLIAVTADRMTARVASVISKNRNERGKED